MKSLNDKSYNMRLNLEISEQWRLFIDTIPALKFPPEVTVKIIPPFGGAIARFILSYKDKTISVYLDAFSRLGAMDEIYWEAYPINGDIDRYIMEDTRGLMQAINTELELSTN